MSLVTVLKGLVRGGDDAERRVELSPGGDLVMAQGLPPYAEMSRQGEGWSVISTAAAAALVVRPSTVALITLWNGEANPGGKSYIIDRLFAHNLVGVANNSYGLWATIHPAGMAKPTTVIAASATNYVGNTGKLYVGLAIAKVDMTVGDNGWFPWGVSGHTITVTTPGQQIEARVEGRLIVPPQGGISVTVVATAIGSTFTCGLSWYEKRAKLE